MSPPLWLSLSASAYIGYCLRAAVDTPLHFLPAAIVAALLASSLALKDTTHAE